MRKKPQAPVISSRSLGSKRHIKIKMMCVSRLTSHSRHAVARVTDCSFFYCKADNHFHHHLNNMLTTPYLRGRCIILMEIHSKTTRFHRDTLKSGITVKLNTGQGQICCLRKTSLYTTQINNLLEKNTPTTADSLPTIHYLST